MVNPIDRLSTLSASDAPKSANASRLSGLLASSLLLVIGAAVCLLLISIVFQKIDSVSAYQYKPVIMISYKEYAALKIESNKQFKCLSQLYGKESAWNYKAYNPSSGTVGIPQGKSVWLLTATPIQQVEWGLRYIKHRYSTPCNAWAHWRKYNWH